MIAAILRRGSRLGVTPAGFPPELQGDASPKGQNYETLAVPLLINHRERAYLDKGRVRKMSNSGVPRQLREARQVLSR